MHPRQVAIWCENRRVRWKRERRRVSGTRCRRRGGRRPIPPPPSPRVPASPSQFTPQGEGRRRWLPPPLSPPLSPRLPLALAPGIPPGLASELSPGTPRGCRTHSGYTRGVPAPRVDRFGRRRRRVGPPEGQPQWGLDSPSEPSRLPPLGPGLAQAGPRLAQTGSRLPPLDPKFAQKGPRTRPDGP